MKMNKQFFLYSILLFFSKMTAAQQICPLDGNLALLYIKNSSEVTIKTKYFDASNAGITGIYKFRKSGDKVKCESLNYDPLTKTTDTFQEPGPYYYPELVKIKNNGFALSNTEGDSLILDEKERVIKAYRKLDEQRKSFIYVNIRYINDTTILENQLMPHVVDSSFYIYELDSKLNLKAIKEGVSIVPFVNVTISDIDFFNIIKFVYTGIDKKVGNIQTYIVKGKDHILQTTQTFIYKNGRPVKSQVFDAKSRKIIYEQTYSYK